MTFNPVVTVSPAAILRPPGHFYILEHKCSPAGTDLVRWLLAHSGRAIFQGNFLFDCFLRALSEKAICSLVGVKCCLFMFNHSECMQVMLSGTNTRLQIRHGQTEEKHIKGPMFVDRFNGDKSDLFRQNLKN